MLKNKLGKKDFIISVDKKLVGNNSAKFSGRVERYHKNKQENFIWPKKPQSMETQGKKNKVLGRHFELTGSNEVPALDRKSQKKSRTKHGLIYVEII